MPKKPRNPKRRLSPAGKRNLAKRQKLLNTNFSVLGKKANSRKEYFHRLQDLAWKQIGKADFLRLKKGAGPFLIPKKANVNNWILRKTMLDFFAKNPKKNIQLFRDAFRFEADESLRKDAVNLLRKSNDKASAPFILSELKKEDNGLYFRLSCAKALNKLGGKKERTELQRMLKEKHEFAETPLMFRLALASSPAEYRKVLREMKEKEIIFDLNLH